MSLLRSGIHLAVTASAAVLGVAWTHAVASADTFIGVKRAAARSGACSVHEIEIVDKATKPTVAKTETGNYLWYRYLRRNTAPLASGITTADVADEFVAASSTYYDTFAAAPLPDGEAKIRQKSPALLTYYYCPSKGVLKWGTGKSFLAPQPTIQHEVSGGAGTFLSTCNLNDRAKLVICPILGTDAAVQVVERAWRNKYKAGNHDMEIHDKKLVPNAPTPSRAYATALLSTTGFDANRSDVGPQVQDFLAICAAAEREDNRATSGGEQDRNEAALRQEVNTICSSTKAVFK